MFERNAKLINRKFYQYLIPSILTIFAMQFASLLDGIIVGNLLGGQALTATGLVMPILYIIQMPGFALGVGGSIVVGNLLGKRDLAKANKAFSACIIYGMLVSIALAALAPLISGPIASLFSSDENIVELGRQYIFIYLVTDPLITIALLLASFMAVDNNPRLSSIAYILGNVIKIGSMFLFIQVFNMGLYGAALSTGFGFFIGILVVVFYIKSNKRLLKFTLKIKGTFKDLKESIKASSVTAINMVLTAIQMTIVNVILGKVITTDSDLLIFGLLANMVFAFDLLVGGVQGVIPTICTILYGEKDYYSLKDIVRKIFLINLGISLVLTALILIVPNVYASIYNYEETNKEILDRAYMLIRVYVIGFTFYELNKFIISYYPALEKNIPAHVNVVLRDAVIVLPLTIVLLYTHGLFGYVIAQVITEVASVILSYIFIFIYGKKCNQGEGLFLLQKDNFISYDVSVDNDIKNAGIISSEITEFALKNKIDNRNAQIVGLAAEEIIANIIHYGYKNKHQNFIDVNLKIDNDLMLLRIRDDGLPFDPTKYEFDDDEAYTTSGIKMIEKLTDKMTYMRILSMNNTIFEIKINNIANE